MPVDRLSCHEMVELVTDYLEDALIPHEEARVQSHLNGCACCQAYLEQMRWTVRLLSNLSEPAPAVKRAQRPALLERVFHRHRPAFARAWTRPRAH